jgi:hypothetical protein
MKRRFLAGEETSWVELDVPNYNNPETIAKHCAKYYWHHGGYRARWPLVIRVEGLGDFEVRWYNTPSFEAASVPAHVQPWRFV